MERIDVLEAKRKIVNHESDNGIDEDFREQLYNSFEIIDKDDDLITQGCIQCDSFTNCHLIGTDEPEDPDND